MVAGDTPSVPLSRLVPPDRNDDQSSSPKAKAFTQHPPACTFRSRNLHTTRATDAVQFMLNSMMINESSARDLGVVQ